MSKRIPHVNGNAPPGWCSIKDAAEYAGVKPRTVRSWLKKGLRHVVVSKKMKLTKYEYIDEFLEGFHPDPNADINSLADEIYNQVVGQN